MITLKQYGRQEKKMKAQNKFQKIMLYGIFLSLVFLLSCRTQEEYPSEQSPMVNVNTISNVYSKNQANEKWEAQYSTLPIGNGEIYLKDAQLLLLSANNNQCQDIELFNTDNSEQLYFLSIHDGRFLAMNQNSGGMGGYFILDTKSRPVKNYFLSDVTFSKPCQLENGLVAYRRRDSIEQLCLLDIDTGNELTLRFNYGLKKAAGYSNAADYYEYFADTIVFDTSSQQYIMAYAKFNRNNYAQLNSSDDIGTLGICIFDKHGEMIDNFLLPDIKLSIYSKNAIDFGNDDLFVINDGLLIFSPYYEFINPTIKIEYKTHKYSILDNDELLEEIKFCKNLRLKQQDKIFENHFFSKVCLLPEPCPVKIFYTNNVTKIYSANDRLITTIPEQPELSFYTVDINGDCYLLFNHARQQKS